MAQFVPPEGADFVIGQRLELRFCPNSDSGVIDEATYEATVVELQAGNYESEVAVVFSGEAPRVMSKEQLDSALGWYGSVYGDECPTPLPQSSLGAPQGWFLVTSAGV